MPLPYTRPRACQGLGGLAHCLPLITFVGPQSVEPVGKSHSGQGRGKLQSYPLVKPWLVRVGQVWDSSGRTGELVSVVLSLISSP